MTGSPSSSADLSWSEQHLRTVFGDTWAITGADEVPSRISVVHRIVAEQRSTSERRCFFLKRFPESETASHLDQQCATLHAIASTVTGAHGITPFVIVACDPERRLVLTAEVPGEPITSLHRRLERRCGVDADEVVSAWRGVGRWLGVLHSKTATSVGSATRPAEVAAYTEERLLWWAAADPARKTTAQTAIEVVRLLASRCHGSAPLCLCHGDVSGFNILVHGTVGLVDFDDARVDLPGLDLSQAVLEIRHLSRVMRCLPLSRVRARAERALVEGYGTHVPDGPEFWLQHFRNLAVFLVTLARQRRGLTLSRVTDELRYARTLAELKHSISVASESDQRASFWQSARVSTISQP